MPTYEYVCTSCGHRLEAVQSFSDPALTTCPDCEGALRKVFVNVGIVLKGSGFYKNDSRTGSRSNGSGGPPKEGKEKESSTSKDSGTKESSSTKDSSASTPSSSSSGDSASSEKAAASNV